MRPTGGSTPRESSQDSPLTDETQTQTQFFFPEWIVGVFFGGRWHDVKEGSFREGISTDHGEVSFFEDPFSGEAIFILQPITGYRVKKPQPVPSEPEASVTDLFPKS